MFLLNKVSNAHNRFMCDYFLMIQKCHKKEISFFFFFLSQEGWGTDLRVMNDSEHVEAVCRLCDHLFGITKRLLP